LDQLVPYARAVELTHLASLIHDDVIDKSDKRRNHPTLNALKNNTTAILAGDYVLASVMQELAVAGPNEILIDLTKCIQDLADGEWLQYDLKNKKYVSQSDLEEICIKKTGSLIRFCCTTPAKLAGFGQIPLMTSMGEKIGLIFQMADDIVDGFESSGRPAFQDLSNGQLNYVTLKLIELFPDLNEQIQNRRGQEFNTIPWSMKQYTQAVEQVHHDISSKKFELSNMFEQLNPRPDLKEIFLATLSKIQMNYLSQLDLPHLANG
jgi:geranylgeranyl pyrophosphate synthase